MLAGTTTSEAGNKDLLCQWILLQIRRVVDVRVSSLVEFGSLIRAEGYKLYNVNAKSPTCMHRTFISANSLKSHQNETNRNMDVSVERLSLFYGIN
jgi:hypothetical protein